MVDGRIGLRTRMRLYVGIGCAKKFLGPVDGNLLDLIHHFTASIIAFAGIALGIFVGQHRAGGFHDRWTGKVLRSNQFNAVKLAFVFLLNQIKYVLVSHF